MDEIFSANRTGDAYEMHPCYEIANRSYINARSPSVQCVFVYIALSLCSIFTVCGNLLVIISIGYFKQLHTPTNCLVLSLAVADLFMGLLVFPFSMAFTVTSCIYKEHVICKIRDSFDVALCTSSILHLCCISVDRYYAVCKPLTYRTRINNRVVTVMILVSWSIAAAMGYGTVTIVISGVSQENCEGDCSVNVLLANIMGPVMAFFLPAIVMLCIYMKIFLVAQKQARNIHNANCQRGKKPGAAAGKMERKATKTLAIVMGVFLLCMSPYFACALFQPLLHQPTPLSIIEALNWLTLSNSMLNPFIYAFFYSWFRSAFRIIISGKIFYGDFTNSKLH